MKDVINLDSYIPDYELSPKKLKKGTKKQFYNLRLAGHSGKVGISPEKIINWRRIEKRFSQLLQLEKQAHSMFSSELKRMAPDASRKKEAWFIIDEEKILQFSGESFTIGLANEEVKRLIGGKNDSKFVLIGGDDGRRIGRLERRSWRLQHVTALYRAAFQKAVKDRLQMLIDERNSKTRKNYYYTEPFTIIVSNEGREHVFSVSYEGHITHHNGDILRTT